MNLFQRYVWNIIVWLDQGINTFFFGDPDETVSSRAAKAAARGKTWGCCLCKFLDLFDKGHCANTVEQDEGINAIRQ